MDRVTSTRIWICSYLTSFISKLSLVGLFSCSVLTGALIDLCQRLYGVCCVAVLIWATVGVPELSAKHRRALQSIIAEYPSLGENFAPRYIVRTQIFSSVVSVGASVLFYWLVCSNRSWRKKQFVSTCFIILITPIFFVELFLLVASCSLQTSFECCGQKGPGSWSDLGDLSDLPGSCCVQGCEFGYSYERGCEEVLKIQFLHGLETLQFQALMQCVLQATALLTAFVDWQRFFEEPMRPLQSLDSDEELQQITTIDGTLSFSTLD